ncbi:hypothetical protein [Mesorhizobium sp. M0060]|uniref:hypothetical protein n=1 Tax=Mesorhizobium sp. M0060 TaxID=2956866 RepID=UPI003335E1B6
MTEKTVTLSRRYEAHGAVFETVKVREPRFNDLMQLGEPYEMQRAAGNNVVIENVETVAAYVRRCVIEPGFDMLGELGIKDARAVRVAVLDFFTYGEPATASPASKSEPAPMS